MKTAIHEKISGLRKAKGLTQEQLGAKLGISGQAVSKWEKGESLPDILLLPELCKLLEVSADSLLEVPALPKEGCNLIKVSNDRGLTFEIRGDDHRNDCLKLKYEDVVRYLSVFTNELTFEVMKQIPFIGDEYTTPSRISAITGFSEEEVAKALRILIRQGMVKDVTMELNDEEINGNADKNLESKYWQDGDGVIGMYMVLSGCMGSCESENVIQEMVTQTQSKTVTVITPRGDGTYLKEKRS